jgi:hypothetical protein
MKKNLRQRCTNFARRIVFLFIMNFLWRYIPRIYELLFPGEWSSMNSFGRVFDHENSDLLSDVSHVEKIWSKFSAGLNDEQLRKELRLMANI